MKKLFTRFGTGGAYAILFALLVALNIAITPFAYKLDLSKGKAHTLSDSTKKILRNIKDKATVTFFVSETLPSRVLPLKRDVDDILSEFKRESGGRVVVEQVDPKNDQKKQALAQEFGITPLQVSQQESDKFAIATAYFGLGISYNGKKATIAQATGVGDLEYNISSSIYKLGIKELPTVGFMNVEGLENQLSTFAQVASSQFQIAPSSTPSASLKALVVFDNAQPVATDSVQMLSNYINGGGKALVFAEGVRITEDGSMTAQKADHTLTGLLRTYGITLNQDLVLSANADFVNFSPDGNQTQLMVAYPYWLRTNVFDTQLSYFSNINQLSFPWTSSLTVADPAAALVKTTRQSWNVDKDFSIDPQRISEPNSSQIKQYDLIAHRKTAKGGEIIVVPSARFIQDRYMSGESGNLEFVLNVLNEFASGGALTGIRARAVEHYLLPPLDEAQKSMFRYVNIFALPALFTAVFVLRLYRRNRRSGAQS